MILIIPQVLDQKLLKQYQELLSNADWQDGKKTAGNFAMQSKKNLQLNDQHPLSIQLSEHLLSILSHNTTFLSAALPLKIFPPRFNRYADGDEYGNHIDSAVLTVPNTPHRIRSDISATLFLNDPSEYDGGELIIEDFTEKKNIKLNAGDMIIYPSTFVHRVTPVTRGIRMASFFWIQSLVQQMDQRNILFNLDCTIQSLRTKKIDQPDIDNLMGVYHNTLRQWSQT